MKIEDKIERYLNEGKESDYLYVKPPFQKWCKDHDIKCLEHGMDVKILRKYEKDVKLSSTDFIWLCHFYDNEN